jgi:hypothetical protein
MVATAWTAGSCCLPGTEAHFGGWQAGKGNPKENGMRLLSKTLASAAIGAGLLAASAMSASAAIVCNGNVCWHTHDAYDYPHGAKVVVHEDDWKWAPHEHYTFREHEGRGYWRGSRWIGW